MLVQPNAFVNRCRRKIQKTKKRTVPLPWGNRPSVFSVDVELIKTGEDTGRCHGNQPRHGDGQAAHGAFSFAQLHRAGRPDCVGRCSDGKPAGHWFSDAQQAQNRFRHDVSLYPRQDDDGDCDGRDAAQLLRNTHANGGGDRFGQEGDILLVRKAEQCG